MEDFGYFGDESFLAPHESMEFDPEPFDIDGGELYPSPYAGCATYGEDAIDPYEFGIVGSELAPEFDGF